MQGSKTPGIQEVVNELEGLKENRELTGLTGPIIEALQFQDRLRQNLENVCRVVEVWREYKKKGVQDLDEGAAKEFGERLLGCMTSVEERDVVRQLIPGLEEEKTVVEDVMMF